MEEKRRARLLLLAFVLFAAGLVLLVMYIGSSAAAS